VTVVTGPIALVALAAPQVARRLTRSGAVDLPTSALVAATLLTLSDLLALHAIPGTAIPVGAVTVSLGGLYLVWLLARETSRR
jgi:iron complex transport system permease protein